MVEKCVTSLRDLDRFDRTFFPTNITSLRDLNKFDRAFFLPTSHPSGIFVDMVMFFFYLYSDSTGIVEGFMQKGRVKNFAIKSQSDATLVETRVTYI